MTTVWDEWGSLTRFLESARLAFARERRLWHSLELENRESVLITAPSGDTGTYKVSLEQHVAAIDDEETLCASVLIHSYALTESVACDKLGLDSRSAGGIENWAARLLTANGRSWSNVFDGESGAVEVAAIRNAFAYGSRLVDQAGEARLRSARRCTAQGIALHCSTTNSADCECVYEAFYAPAERTFGARKKRELASATQFVGSRVRIRSQRDTLKLEPAIPDTRQNGLDRHNTDSCSSPGRLPADTVDSR